MKNTTSKLLAFMMAALFILSAAGCGQPSTPTPGVATTAAGSTATTAAGSTATTAAGGTATPTAGKSFTYCVDWPPYIDPGVGSNGVDTVVFANAYDALTFPMSDGSTAPHVAESWNVSDDSTVYTFKLRKDVKFHSGNPLTANDVKYSMDRLLTMGEGFAYLFTGLVTAVEVVDDYTISFTLSAPSGTFAGMLIRLCILDEKLVREHYEAGTTYGDHGDYGKTWLLTNDAGSGPFAVQEVRLEEYIILARNDSYWLDMDPNVPESVKLIGGVDGAAMRTMFSRGEVDITNETQTEETYQELAAMEGATLTRAAQGVNFNICLNTKMAPTDDVHVRRAMAYAFDYDAMHQNIYVGSTKPTGPIDKGLAASALSESEMPYNYNLELAKAELEQSPYYAQLMDGSMTIALTWCTEGGVQQEKTALLVQAGMSAVGVKVELTGKPFATMMTDAATPETTANATFVAFAPSYLDGSGYLRARYHSSAVGSWEQMEWLQNAEIDAMIEEAITIAGEGERNEMYREISRKLVELCPSVWMGDMATTRVYRTSLVTCPSVEKFLAGEPFIYAMGYGAYFREYRIVN